MENEINQALQNQPKIIQSVSDDSSIESLKTKKPSTNVILFSTLLIALGVAAFWGYKYYQLLDDTKSLELNKKVTSEKLNKEISTENSVLTAAPTEISAAHHVLSATPTGIPAAAATIAASSDSDLINSDENQSIKPAGWISHVFPAKNLTIYTPSQWKSSSENFPDIPSTLIRFWEAGDQNNATIQLNITDNWNNIGVGPKYTFFTIADNIQAYRIDPPKKEEKTLDRYQTSFFFERKGKVYSLVCVHNWMKINIETCEKMLQTMEFSD